MHKGGGGDSIENEEGKNFNQLIESIFPLIFQFFW